MTANMRKPASWTMAAAAMLLVSAINNQDFPVIQAVAVITVTGFALSNLAADLLYAALDPKIQLND